MNTAITILLDETLDQMLNTVSTQTGQSRNEIVGKTYQNTIPPLNPIFFSA